MFESIHTSHHSSHIFGPTRDERKLESWNIRHIEMKLWSICLTELNIWHGSWCLQSCLQGLTFTKLGQVWIWQSCSVYLEKQVGPRKWILVAEVNVMNSWFQGLLPTLLLQTIHSIYLYFSFLLDCFKEFTYLLIYIVQNSIWTLLYLKMY